MKISIITPSFNQGKYIDQTIKSVLHQQGDFELEYIVIDGGSDDNTLDIIEKHASRDNRLKWVSEPDNGQSEAINKGLRMATGDIVTYLNSDDTYNENSLNKVINFFKKNKNIKWVFGKCRIINEDNQEIRKLITKYKNFFLKRYSYNKLLTENFISQPAVFWKRELLEEIGFINEEEHYCMDYEYWLRLGQKYKPGFINKYLSNFRYYSDSKSGGVDKKQFQDELRLAKKYGENCSAAIFLHKINYFKIILIYKMLNIFE
ncbi:MAG: glycosyltransferase family 2 protein [Patescibacteria group bacterium]